MSNPFLEEPASSSPRAIQAEPHYENAYDDDDEDDAYDDDEEGITVTGSGSWCTCAGFASPEWWSRH